MVDVKSYSCFPTMIYEFKGIDKANHLKMSNIVDFEKHCHLFDLTQRFFTSFSNASSDPNIDF